MLTRIEISNYKSIANADLALKLENVIVGPNGVGKSNLLDAIHFIRDAANDGLDHAVTKRYGITSIRRWSKTRPYHINIKLTFESPDHFGEYRVSISSAGGDFSVVEEEGIWCAEPPIIVGNKDETRQRYHFKRQGTSEIVFDIPGNPFGKIPSMSVPESEIFLSQVGPRSFSTLALFFRDLYDEIASCGAYSIYPNRIREPQSISNMEVLADDGSNLASIIRRMRATSARQSREQLTAALRQVMPILTEIRIESAGGFYVPVFRVKESSTGYSHDLNMSQVSDGSLRMLGMLTAFYQPKAPNRITMEEPEQMIHPGLLPILIESSRDYLSNSHSEDRQVFFTTHSPNLLDMFDPGAIIGCSFDDGISRFSHMSDRQLDIIRSNLFSAGELLVAEGIFE